LILCHPSETLEFASNRFVAIAFKNTSIGKWECRVMKRFIYSAAVASALLATAVMPSKANIVDLGDIPPTATFAGNSSVPTSYGTTWTFTLVSNSFVDITGAMGNIATFVISLPSISFVSIASPPFTAFNGSGDLAAGTYSLLVSGIGGTDSSPISLYNGTISAVATTPVPGALVLFASGLGLLGFWGWSKRRKVGSGLDSLNAVAC
jgi:hypothetical protein